MARKTKKIRNKIENKRIRNNERKFRNKMTKKNLRKGEKVLSKKLRIKSRRRKLKRGGVKSSRSGVKSSRKEVIVKKLITMCKTRIREKKDCAICCENLSRQNKVVELQPCKHSFHDVCISEWMKKKMTCPLCRAEIKNIIACKNYNKVCSGNDLAQGTYESIKLLDGGRDADQIREDSLLQEEMVRLARLAEDEERERDDMGEDEWVRHMLGSDGSRSRSRSPDSVPGYASDNTDAMDRLIQSPYRRSSFSRPTGRARR